MTAPIVYELRNGIIPDRELFELARSLRDADLTVRSLGLVAREGQLWERLAEHDLDVHGEPKPLDLEAHKERHEGIESIHQSIVRSVLAANIERRRPAMRAAHKGAA